MSLSILVWRLFFNSVKQVVDVVTHFVVAGADKFVVLILGIFPGFLAALFSSMANPFVSS